MHRTFISTIIAAALTITGISSTMAQAGEYRRAPQVHHRNQNTVDPLAAAIAGVVALAIIGKAIDNNGGFKKNSHPQKKYVQPQRSHKQQRAHRGHNTHRQFSNNGHNNRRANEWHRHGNGHGHKHPHGRRHHRGRH
ncbi:hypothetical protein [Planktotalea sp.]|uniref:hypothetical protein n=1 Tax=Planktotalea sp. TaxID=2029877 RepID=UPI0025D123E5|nr:hypothetical protein [Planktotalea sp.]